jgi:hypothetical protein
MSVSNKAHAWCTSGTIFKEKKAQSSALLAAHKHSYKIHTLRGQSKTVLFIQDSKPTKHTKLAHNAEDVSVYTPVHIVTCRPIVGLRNKALLGDRPVKTRDRKRAARRWGKRAVPSRTAWSAATQQPAMTSHGSTLVSKATPVNTVTGQQATVPLVRLRVYKRK